MKHCNLHITATQRQDDVMILKDFAHKFHAYTANVTYNCLPCGSICQVISQLIIWSLDVSK